MTPEQHNKYVGIAHLAYAGFYCLLIFAMLGFMGLMFSTMPPPRDAGEPPSWFFAVVFGFMAVFYSLLITPSILAGYALLKRKSWAKGISIAAAVLAAMFFPIGTAVAVYTFWFVFSEPGRLLYAKRLPGLPPAPPTWSNAIETQLNEPRYAPPSNPPDWR
jgi:hypothetical protein